MQVTAFAAAQNARLLESGGVSADGFPMTSCQVASFPIQMTVPLVLSVYASGGTEYQPHRYIIAKSPEGERVGLLEFAWEWPDNPGVPLKFRVFAHHLPMTAYGPGVYTIGLYEDPEGGEPEFEFPLPILRVNPLTGAP
ncbi:Uncharacterised protein [Mycolicibacterium phlei]|nr:hypothetical protein MPHLCCUG_04249 [Mycolicibacterium phlei]KXW75911.1 hypothetical protein JL15_19735 [Mycolicibacterium phlei DSM 43071]STZ21499.1 Uncharacterised protein [Mycolicibacterium phlei]VEG11135.1 Uncharacterised protein [Mycobacteroides chelonae]